MLSISAMTQEQYAIAYSRGYPKTRGFMLSRGISRDLSEDLAQAAWARGWEYREQVRDVDKVDAWVNTIALNLLRNSFRQVRISEFPDEASVASLTSPQSIDVQRLLTRCSPADRNLIEGHYMAGYTSFELGRQLGCSAVAVRVRLLRLRRRLRATMTRKELPELCASAV
jgi:RNA polymerase sigma-70 factor (ECF subfamily)